MGELTLWEKIKKWASEEMDWQAVGERVFQKNTLYGLFVGLSTLGVWKVAPEKLLALEGLLIFLWTIYQVGHNKKKAIRKEIEKAVE